MEQTENGSGSASEAENLPVVAAEVRAIEPARPAVSPAVQAAAVGAASVVAGAATVAVVRHALTPSRRRARKVRRARKQLGQVVSSRSFLVDVHLLDRD